MYTDVVKKKVEVKMYISFKRRIGKTSITTIELEIDPINIFFVLRKYRNSVFRISVFN